MDANNRRERETDEAAQWWVRLGARPPHEVPREDREQFTRWLRESPLHVAEILHIAHVHDTLGRFKLWKELPEDSPDEDRVVALGQHNKRKTGRRLIALAASVAAFLIAGFILQARFQGERIATDLAERREVMLEDGSTVRLEPETSLRVRLEAHERRLALERGRALFRVAKDENRPFLVEIGNTQVRAVGTAFGIERKHQHVIVTVAEGKVAVLPPSPVARVDTEGSPASERQEGASSRPAQSLSGSEEGREEREVLLSAGQQLTVQKSGSPAHVRKVDSARELAWTEGRLVFDATPLRDVVEEFNRYNRQQLRVEDPELARRPVSGVFQASDPETFIEFVRNGARVNVIRHDSQEIIIAPRG